MERQDDLAERLEAFADVELRPDPAAMARIRRKLVAEAGSHHRFAWLHRSKAAAGTVMSVVPANPRSAGAPSMAPCEDGRPVRAGATWLRRLERLMAGSSFHAVQRAGLAAGGLALALGLMCGASVASAPGAPLYGTRIWLESATLPAHGSSRVLADVTLLNARLGEARSAVLSRDRGGLAAALDAYTATAEDAARNVQTAADRERLNAVLTRHRNLLLSLVGGTDGGTSAEASGDGAIQTEIEGAESEIELIEDHDGDADDGAGAGSNLQHPSSKPGLSGGPAAGGDEGSGAPAGADGEAGNGTAGDGGDANPTPGSGDRSRSDAAPTPPPGTQGPTRTEEPSRTPQPTPAGSPDRGGHGDGGASGGGGGGEGG